MSFINDGTKGQHIVLRTAEWFGDEELILDFPPGWQLNVRNMDGHDTPQLSEAELATALQNTIGTKPLSDIADGAESVTITFDDLSRPTPTWRIIPHVLDQLKKAGVPQEGIIFQAATGTHPALFQPQMAQKVGRDIVANYPVWNHDPFHGLDPIGTTSRGNEIRLNSRFVRADVKICLSCVKPHQMTGYGGGAKSIVPGVAWIDSAFYIHHTINTGAGCGVGILNCDPRLDMEEAARMAGVDLSVNMVLNGTRQICGLFAGDIVDAHRAAATVAHSVGNTPPDSPADIVVINSYPQAVQATKELRFAAGNLVDGGSVVLIQDTPAGQSKMHYGAWRGTEGWNQPRAESGLPVKGAGQVIVYNRNHAKWDEKEFSPEVKFRASWDDILELLTSAHGKSATVKVLPTAPLQHESVPLII